MRSRGLPVPPVAAVFAAWLAAVVAIGIRGDFPLSDDWAYAHVVRSLAAGRGFDFLPWTGATVVAQAVYGAVITAVTGFSYEVLRTSTLMLSAVAGACLYALLIDLGATASVAAAGVAAVLLSPVWLNLSFTFMTDVPFAATAVLATWLFVRGFVRDSRALLFAASIAAAIAFLIRQHGIWIAAAAAATPFVIAALDRRAHARGDASVENHGSGTIRRAVVDAAVAFAVPLAVAAVYVLWTMTSAIVPLAVQNKIGEAASVSLLAIGNAAYRGAATLGFLLLPWAVVLRPQCPAERRAFAAILAVLAAAAVFLFVREDATMFYLGNMLADLRIGPLTTRDAQFLARETWPALGPVFRLVLTAASILSAAIVAARLAAGFAGRLRPTAPPTRGFGNTARTHRARCAAAFCVLAFAFSALGSLAQSHYFFDRYLAVLVPLAIAAIVAVSPPLELRRGFRAALLVLSTYAVAGTHDYMAWNRARWDLLAGLEARGVGARSIDGGVEYNGERLAAELRTSPSDAAARRGQPKTTKSWWWVVDDEWIVALTPLDGYRVAGSREFVRWMPPGRASVLLLQRHAGGG